MVFRIDEPNAAGVLPAPDVAGTEGFFTAPNPGSGQTPVKVRSWWLNMLQEELRAFPIAAGITPSKTSNGQVLQATRRLFRGNAATIAASATLTVDQAGLVLVDATAGNITLTLPAANALGAPYGYDIRRIDSASAHTVSIAVPGGSTAFPAAGPFAIAPLGILDLQSAGGTIWFAENYLVRGQFGSAGYRIIPTDSGVAMIEQWGVATTTTGNGDTITFTTPFPNGCWNIQLTENGAHGWGSTPQPTVYGIDYPTASNFKVYGTRISTTGVPSYQSGLSFNWRANGW